MLTSSLRVLPCRLGHGQLNNLQHARPTPHTLSRGRSWSIPAQPDDQPENDGNLEDMFAQELKRRRMEGNNTDSKDSGAEAKPKDPFSSTATRQRAPPPPKAVTDGTGDQRQRSLSMVNEGLEGLIPRASQLLQLGGSVFLAFLPFMLVISLLFSGIYLVFGESFVHRGTPSANPPQYIDPERLLSETTVDPYVPFDR